LQRLKILFVDNDLGVHDKLRLALERGFVVQGVTSLREARAYLELSLPDILILEVSLGQEDGLELCRYVRSNLALSLLPIMLLTSRTTLPDKIAGFDAGADDYVVKPFDVYHLQARIRLLARIKRLEQRVMTLPLENGGLQESSGRPSL